MKKNRIAIIVAILLLVCSFNLLALAVVYYKVEDNAINFRYSDDSEYSNIQEGIDFISKLPIQFNITNKFFSNFDNLDADTRESIILAYAIKNRYNTYKCDDDICIDRDSLNSEELLEKFNTKKKMSLEKIKLYIDDYGAYNIKVGKNSNTYRIKLDSDNHKYRKYSSFSHYKETNDVYTFYFYEGFFKANCYKGDKLELYDFITGDVVYSDTCNGYNDFAVLASDNIKKLQLYKYELKKDENGKFYISGYNPVNS